MEDENTITLTNLQLMIANLSLDNARLQARVKVLSKRVQELEAAGGKATKEAAHE
ncbi:hypothetical protein [Gardnerella vaginalis]|uniref:hypothetical protein n=1 Tax=Gardnerella vaginalis TaxID=2702 RepID=UPI00200F39C8|nr:hypothetical protein [Gardnerella vaginalis]UQA84481.1 hypothetical protein K9E40_05480 [Gardnerella vaginalis]